LTSQQQQNKTNEKDKKKQNKNNAKKKINIKTFVKLIKLKSILKGIN
jgi:hypothetical protein